MGTTSKRTTTSTLRAGFTALGRAVGAFTRRTIAGDGSAQRDAEGALQAAEERFHAIFDQAFQFTLLLTPSGEIVEANETSLTVHGGPRGVLVGRPVWDLPAWSPPTREAIRAAVESAAGRAFVRIEETGIDSGGRDVAFDMSFKPMRDADGRVAMLIYEGRDVTGRKASEAALRASEAKFSGILAIAADAIITVDAEQRVVHFNRAAEALFGYAAHEMIGQPLGPLLPDAARDAHPQHVARFHRAPESSRGMGTHREVTARRRDGEEFPIEASISKLEIDGGVLFTVALRDITDRKRAEVRRRVLADATAALGGSLDDGQSLAEVARLALRTLGDACVVDLDADGGLQAIAVAHIDPTREAAVREMHRHPADVDGSHPLAVVRRTRQPLLVPAVDGVPPLGVRSAMFVPLTVRDHFLGVLSYYNAGPRRFDEEDLALACELGRRVALAIDNARLYRESQRASAARDVVLALVSHDLRNPLSTIGMCATSLLDPAPISPDEMRSIADTINLSVDWTQRIIRDLLDVTSIEAGRLALGRSPVPVAAVLASACEVMRVHAQAAGVELADSEEGGPATIDADHDRVLQVLLNLLGNAVKYTPKGGRITMCAALERAVDAPAAFVRFSVGDTGPGIAPDDLPHVFDRYWQMDRAGRAGAGLGLAIAKGIVEAHGGSIAVTSTVGLGSTFSFTILAAAAAAAPTPVGSSGAVPATGAEPEGDAT